MSQRVSWIRMREALVALNEGATVTEAALAAGIGRRTLIRYTNKHGRMPVRARKLHPQHLTPEERDEIAIGIAKGLSNRQIGETLGRPRGTIWREISRNGGREEYRALAAEARACDQARRPQIPWWQARPWLWQRVIEGLRLWWSPEQIAGLLRFEHPDDPDWHVSYEAIYQAIFIQAKGTLKTELAACLRQGRVQRRSQSRSKTTESNARIKGMVPISERPSEAKDRAVPGHWEGDLIIGKNSRSAIATIVERTTRFGFMVRLDSKDAEHVAERIAEEAKRLGDIAFKSLTWDQGTELADHATFTTKTGVDVYFADPRSPWQRGTNENWNGLARQYFPKGTDLSVHTQEDLDEASHSLNTRPRKTLGWQTPAVMFNQLVAPTP